MKKYNGYEIAAVNTAGLWYTVVFKNDKCVYSGVAGHEKRGNAFTEGEVLIDEGLAG